MRTRTALQATAGLLTAGLLVASLPAAQAATVTPTGWWASVETFNQQTTALVGTGDYYMRFGSWATHNDDTASGHGSTYYTYKDRSFHALTLADGHAREGYCIKPPAPSASRKQNARHQCWVKDAALGDDLWHPIPRKSLTVNVTPAWITASYVNEQTTNRAPAVGDYHYGADRDGTYGWYRVELEPQRPDLGRAGNWFTLDVESASDTTGKPTVQSLAVTVTDIDHADPDGFMHKTDFWLTSTRLNHALLTRPSKGEAGAPYRGVFIMTVEYALFAGDR